MKKTNVVVRVIIFIVIVFISDKLIGTVCQKLYYKSNDHTIHRLRYTLDSTREDILIFGSSRAQHHFIPSVISEQTGLTTYNCGFGGEGLLFSFIQLNETLKRYKPQLVVLELSPNILIDPESEQKLKILMPFNNRDSLIFGALTNDELFERVKLLSSIYPYNSTIASLITGRFKKNIDTLSGFEPLHGVIDTVALASRISKSFETTAIPSDRLDVMKDFIALCNNKGVKVALVMSPVYQTNGNYDEMTNRIKANCARFDSLTFWDFTKLDGFYNNPIYFRDNLHLNYAGAKAFSDTISVKLAEIVKR